MNRPENELIEAQLKYCKEEYDNIPVPKEAKLRMEEGIMRAKREESKSVIIKFIKGTGIAAAAALLSIVVLSNSSQSIVKAMEKIPVIGAISKVVTFRTYEDTTNNFEAAVDIPKVEAEDTNIPNDKLNNINKSIEDYANELISMYETDLANSEGQGNYSLSSTYDIVTDNDKYLSLRINTTLIMASGTEFVKIFTIDKSTGEVISLSDFLENKPDKLNAITENIKDQMRTQMAEDEEKTYFIDSEDFAADSDFDKLTGDESFYIDDNNDLVISFDEYQVAPGYMGAVSFTIPSDIYK